MNREGSIMEQSPGLHEASSGSVPGVPCCLHQGSFILSLEPETMPKHHNVLRIDFPESSGYV